MENFLRDYLTLLIKPTTSCNLSCIYCYQKDNQFKKLRRMEDSTLKKLMHEVCGLPVENVALEWIGGETLLAGIEFFEKALFYQKSYNIKGIKISNAIQTNGTLLTDDWIEFLIRNAGYGLSVSYDCFEQLHNKNRVSRDGRGTYKRVRNNIQNLQRNNIPFGILITISESAIKIPAIEWVNCLVDQQLLYVGLQLDYHKYSDKEFIIKYFTFLKNLFIAQANYNQSVSKAENKLLIRESFYLANRIKNNQKIRISCQHTPRGCTSYLLSFGVNGDVYACCDAFMGMSSKEFCNFLCGNITTESLPEIFNSANFEQIYHLMENGKKKCALCDYFQLCNGGCGLFKYIESGKIDSGFGDNIENYCVIQQNYFNLLRDIQTRKKIQIAYEHIN